MLFAMSKQTSHHLCEGCAVLSQHISELEQRISILHRIRKDEDELDSMLAITHQATLTGMESTLPWNGTVTMDVQPVFSRPSSCSTPLPAGADTWAVMSKPGRARNVPNAVSCPILELRNKYEVLAGEMAHTPDVCGPYSELGSTSAQRRRLLRDAVISRRVGGLSSPERLEAPMDAAAVPAADAVSTVGALLAAGAVPAADTISAADAVPAGNAAPVLDADAVPAVVANPGSMRGADLSGEHSAAAEEQIRAVPVVSPVVSDTLIIGDSIIRYVSVKGCETRCFPGATVEDMNTMIPRLLPDASLDSLVVHVGANNVKAGASELLKEDFSKLFDTLWETGKNVTISGPLPCLNRGDMKYSRLRQLHLWLKGCCWYWGIPYVDNFTLFSDRYDLYNRDGVHLNSVGAKLLSRNILDALQSLLYEKNLCIPVN